MIDLISQLSINRQASVLGISRGSVYYQPRPISDADLKLMHRIYKLHMELPFAGSRMLQGFFVQADGLVHPPYPCLADVYHAGGRLLHCWPTRKSRSAWTEKAHGGTMSSSSVFGEPSNMKRSSCALIPKAQISRRHRCPVESIHPSGRTAAYPQR